MAIDVLSVGGIVVDTFIKLNESQTSVHKNQNGELVLSMPFGAKIPFESAEDVQAVGNSANAAISFARLGLNTALHANIGNDQVGRDMLAYLETNKVDTRLMKIHPGKASNHHYVLRYKEDRTILVHDEAYVYHWPHLRTDEMPKWIYFSSMGENSEKFHDDLAHWLERHKEVKLAFQPGTFQILMGVKRLANIYALAEVLAVNREEAVEISGGNYNDLNDLFDRLHGLGSKIVVISDGPNGAYASDGEKRLQMPIYPDPSPPYERTGAGDAFTSTFVAALIHGADIEGALQWGPINSMSVVQHVGAQKGLLTERQLSKLLQNSPRWYRAKPL
ncbi:carbohydrate kinase family protein [Candidatus Saccharibacteria bacterium]|nr:carbohydrate kinase family protein [Candidatus Saccharibacteria bacterium]